MLFFPRLIFYVYFLKNFTQKMLKEFLNYSKNMFMFYPCLMPKFLNKKKTDKSYDLSVLTNVVVSKLTLIIHSYKISVLTSLKSKIL